MKKDTFASINSTVINNERANITETSSNIKDNVVTQECNNGKITLEYNGVSMEIEDLKIIL